MKNFNTNRQSGFTLLEILLVVAAIGILAGIVIFAINPAKQLGDTRNAQRKVDVNTIVNGVYQYSIDNNGAIPSDITSTATEVCSGTTPDECSGLVNLSGLTVYAKYLVSIPIDPAVTTANLTGYNISVDANNRITVAAPNAENEASISVTR